MLTHVSLVSGVDKSLFGFLAFGLIIVSLGFVLFRWRARINRVEWYPIHVPMRALSRGKPIIQPDASVSLLERVAFAISLVPVLICLAALWHSSSYASQILSPVGATNAWVHNGAVLYAGVPIGLVICLRYQLRSAGFQCRSCQRLWAGRAVSYVVEHGNCPFCKHAAEGK